MFSLSYTITNSLFETTSGSIKSGGFAIKDTIVNFMSNNPL